MMNEHKQSTVVLFHGGCRDGFCAAWVASQLGYQHAKFIPVFYAQNPPNVEMCDVLLLDFCYPYEILHDLSLQAASLMVIDHHKTAQEALEKFTGPSVFDVNRSGAGLAWDLLSGGKKRPWLVDYVEDRDLWRNKLPDTVELNAYIAALEFDFAVWDRAAGMELWKAKTAGQACLLKLRQYVREVAKNARTVMFEGFRTKIVNAPQCDISELLDSLIGDNQLAMGWWQRQDGKFTYSLRSRGDFDVSELAKRYGGGGHKNAAGFELTRLLDLKPPSNSL